MRYGTGCQTDGHDSVELLPSAGKSAAAATQRIRGPHDQRQANFTPKSFCLFQRRRDDAAGLWLVDASQKITKQLPVFTPANGIQGRPQQAYAVLVENAGISQVHREIQAGLSSKSGQQTIGPLTVKDAVQYLDCERLHVDAVRRGLIGHDGSRVGVNKHSVDTLVTEGFAGLSAGIVELRSLANDDWPGADNQHLPRLRRNANPIISFHPP